jgi:phage gp36-like protein
MAYADLSDILVRYRPIRTMIGSQDLKITSAEVTSVYVFQAEAYVDAYLGSRYQVPFAGKPPLITQITSDLAIFFMLAEKTPSVPDFMDARRQRADELLKQLADGELTIGSASLVTSAGDSFAWSPNMGHTPVFSPVLGELDQLVDPDRVYADRDARGFRSRDRNGSC